MWEKSNNSKDSGGGFSISDLGDDDSLLKSLIEKDIAKDGDSYKMKK
jgi:hypothetical protein